MPRRRDEDDDIQEDSDGSEFEADDVDESESEEEEEPRRKRTRSDDTDEDDEDYGNRGGRRQKPVRSRFVDDQADVDDDDDVEEDEDGDDDFIEDNATDLPDERVDDSRYHHQRRFRSSGGDDDENVDYLVKRIQDRISRKHGGGEYGDDGDVEEGNDVEQQALLPSVRDPKLWMVKCAIGREREVAVCLMHKFLDRGMDLMIKSVVALDHLKNYIYVEADKEAHVKEVF